MDRRLKGSNAFRQAGFRSAESRIGDNMSDLNAGSRWVWGASTRWFHGNCTQLVTILDPNTQPLQWAPPEAAALLGAQSLKRV